MNDKNVGWNALETVAGKPLHTPSVLESVFFEVGRQICDQGRSRGAFKRVAQRQCTGDLPHDEQHYVAVECFVVSCVRQASCWGGLGGRGEV